MSKPSPADWPPSANLDLLRARAVLLARIRQFFSERDVLEVETPLMMTAQVAEPHLQSFRFLQYALQTSPESAMKRLLAAGSGAIYQVCKAFRANEQGRKHNPEFTLLEWYRPGFSFEAMIEETLNIAQLVLAEKPIAYFSYHEVFFQIIGLNPHTASIEALAAYTDNHIDGVFKQMSRSDYLDLLMSSLVEPSFNPDHITVITDFPQEQVAMAKRVVNDRGETVAKRFELYCYGLELANGYDELVDPVELAQRLGEKDPYLVAALVAGMPESCGVAMGLDRLLMAQHQLSDIAAVLSFDFTRV